MNAQLRHTLLLEPRPVDATDVRVTLTERGWSLCWLRDGRSAEAFGPAFASVPEAARAAMVVRTSHGLD